MLKSNPIPTAKPQAAPGRHVIVAARYNARYVDAMVRAARRVLAAAGARPIEVVRVPGAYEIPVVVRVLADQRPAPVAILCLGVILRGETAHADLIGTAVTTALTQLQLETRLPIVHEVLLLGNAAQARARCLDPAHNRGAEAAHTALAMARLLGTLRNAAA